MSMLELTCRNHPGALYYTKATGGNLHFIRADESVVRKHFADDGIVASEELVKAVSHCPSSAVECPCPISDLIPVEDLAKS